MSHPVLLLIGCVKTERVSDGKDNVVSNIVGPPFRNSNNNYVFHHWYLNDI